MSLVWYEPIGHWIKRWTIIWTFLAISVNRRHTTYMSNLVPELLRLKAMKYSWPYWRVLSVFVCVRTIPEKTWATWQMGPAMLADLANGGHWQAQKQSTESQSWNQPSRWARPAMDKYYLALESGTGLNYVCLQTNVSSSKFTHLVSFCLQLEFQLFIETTTSGLFPPPTELVSWGTQTCLSIYLWDTFVPTRYETSRSEGHWCWRFHLS